MNEQHPALPHWDMSNIYPDLTSEAFQKAFSEGIAAVDALAERYDALGIMLRETPLPVNTETVDTYEKALEGYNTLRSRLHTLYAYVVGFVAVDSRNDEAQARMSELQPQFARTRQLMTRLTAWIGSVEDVEALIAASPAAETHAYALRKAHLQAQHLMSPPEESLAADLNLTGSTAWARLYNNFSSQISVEMEREGERQTLPITAVRNLAFEEDRDLRRRAYEAELAAWEHNAVPLAAALNGIKGEMLTLNERRGWESPLNVALFQNNIDLETLEVMMSTARDYLPELRRYLRAKARALGVERLAWYDLFAPVGESEQRWAFDDARDFILAHFATFSEDLASMARRAFEERWIDAEPRDGKRGGAFCMWVRDAESRILSNYQRAYGGMATLAHELGHAYHNVRRADCTYLQRQTPMTLAETASNFCETIVREAALEKAPPQEQLLIIEASLQDALQVIVDITSRFIFERGVFDKRAERELSVQELNALMLDAQRATYGDGLDPEALHPYMWAVKPHYYGSTFYNFPYMFGLLFSLGLYARYRESPEGFVERYDALLSNTGMANAATLAARFDIDIRSPEFWRASLDLISADVDRFEQLVAVTPQQT